MSEFSDQHVLDVDFETARALHRVVRAMHDGECPKCHALFESHRTHSRSSIQPLSVYDASRRFTDMKCPACGFKISAGEAENAIAAFAPVMERNLAVFETWRRAQS